MEAYRINPSRRDVLKSLAQKGLVTNYAHKSPLKRRDRPRQALPLIKHYAPVLGWLVGSGVGGCVFSRPH